jgi:arylsulfatase
MHRHSLSLLVLAALSWAGFAQAQAKPNIVLILADDLGYAELGCYGQKKIRTPHLDQLAAEGVRFTRFYSGNAVCAPSRCVLMTGKHAGHAFIRNNSEVKPEGQRPIPADSVTVAKLLKAQGYATGAIGKWGLGPMDSTGDPMKQGFDFFFGYNCQRHAHNHYPAWVWRNHERITLEGNDGGRTGKQHTHDLMEAEALRFLQENKDRPFFLYVPFTIPHLALQVPEDSLAEYKGKWDDPPYEGGRGYQPHPHPRAAYAAMVTRLDRGVGRILERIKKLGLDPNTLVFFSSDNGPTHGGAGGSDSAFFESAGPLRGLKGSLYEGGIRVPFLARWPGKIAPGRVSDFAGGFQDILPTVCELAGAAVPKGMDGLSFVPTLLGKDGQKQHGYLYWEFPGYGGQQAIQAGDWKAVRQNLNKGRVVTELYHLGTDLREKQDVAAKHPEVVARLETLMRAARVPSKEFPLKALDGK